MEISMQEENGIHALPARNICLNLNNHDNVKNSPKVEQKTIEIVRIREIRKYKCVVFE